MPEITKPGKGSPEGRNRELTVPAELEALQRDFGSAVAQPFAFDDRAHTWRPRHDAYPAAILNQMVPLPDKDLDGAQRLGTYNEQYWFRLFTTMRKEYPLLNHLAGDWAFNQLVTDYLHAYPSRSQSLRDLGNDLGAFLAEPGRWRRPIFIQAARLDFLFVQAFDAEALPPFDPAHLSPRDAANLDQIRLQFQPHWFLFVEDWTLVALRQRIASGQTDPSEPESGRGFWAVYRSGTVHTTRLGPIQYRLLKVLHEGLTLERALARLEGELSDDHCRFLAEQIGGWFAQWVALGWFAATRRE